MDENDEFITEAGDSLRTLAEKIREHGGDEKPLIEVHGWNNPALSYRNLADMSGELAVKIEGLATQDLTDTQEEILKLVPSRVAKITSLTMPQLPANNAGQAFQVIFTFLEWVEGQFHRSFVVTDLAKPDVVTFELAQKYRALKAQLGELEITREGLDEKMDVIANAYEAARLLPVDREELSETKKKMEADATRSAKSCALAEEYRAELEKHLEIIDEQKTKADSVVKRAEEAYRIATTTGLAGAFDHRAKKLALSTWVWTFGLILSLTAGIFIGSDRLESLSASLEQAPSNTVVVIQFVLSIVGLGAPIWFAWISTKQIGQRFKLAEDYAFKASVAKAYEGYRQEATRLDSEFESRLFGSALDRIEEEPLRLIESGTHSSPFAELIASKRFESVVETDTSLRDRLRSLVNKKDEKDKEIAARRKPVEGNGEDADAE